jgi:class 3 adenylate cyclase/tetratricopeptide (TPR) repeat protein
MSERESLEKAIALQESLRGTVDDAIIDATIATLKEKLAELEIAPQEMRKLATILFMDIAGHTALTVDLDPEEQMALVDPILARFAAQIEAFGGHIARFQGDGFKAVFGLPVAKENDPRQAVRAGLALQKEATKIASELKIDRGFPDFRVRVGISTGLVFAGGKTEGEDTIKGAAVNLAARLESAAEPGMVLVSHDTFLQVRGIFDATPLEPIQAKGFSKPVKVYQVLQAKRHPFLREMRGVEDIDTTMVGRDGELQVLKDAFNTVVDDKEIQVITLIGEAGIGKSRLIYEFESWLGLGNPSFFLYKGQARQSNNTQPYSLLRSMFEFIFEIWENDSPAIVLQKIQDGIATSLPGWKDLETKSIFISLLLGYRFKGSPAYSGFPDDPQQIHDRGEKYFLEYIQGITYSQPLLLLFEDIHWADESSLDLLTLLYKELSNAPVCVITATRPSLLKLRPHWCEGLIYHTPLVLRHLTKNASQRLVKSLLRKVEHLPSELTHAIVQYGEGNPFYLEELVNLMIDRAIIQNDEDVWHVNPDKVASFKPPQSLYGILQNRLEQLPQESKAVLQMASIIGRVFWDVSISWISKESDQPLLHEQVPEILANLREHDFVYRRETSMIVEAVEYLFKHDILRDVTYESVRLDLRKQYHALTAKWLQTHSKVRAVQIDGLIASHLIQADQPLEALQFLGRAAENARARYANKEAVEFFTQSIQILAEANTSFTDSALLINVHHQRGLAFEALGNFDSARIDLEMALQRAKVVGLKDEEWLALLDLGKLWASRDYTITLSYFEEALELSYLLEKSERQAESLNWIGNWHVNADNPQQGIPYHQHALQIIEHLDNKRELAHTLDLLGIAFLMGGNFPECIHFYDQAIQYFQELDDRSRLVSSLSGRAATVSMLTLLGSVSATTQDRATEDILTSLRISKEIEAVSQESWAYWALGLLECVQGKFGDALDSLQNGLQLATEIGHREYSVGNRFALGILLAELFDPIEAKHQLEIALQDASDLGAKTLIHITTGALTGAYLMLGELEMAKSCLGKIHLQELDMDTAGKRYCWIRMAQLALAQHRPAEAMEIVDLLIVSTPGLRSDDVVTFLWKLKAEAAMQMGNLNEAKTSLQEALDNIRDTGEQFLRWRLHVSFGQLNQILRDKGNSQNAFAQARAEIEKLSSTITDGARKKKYLENAPAFFNSPWL